MAMRAHGLPFRELGFGRCTVEALGREEAEELALFCVATSHWAKKGLPNVFENFQGYIDRFVHVEP